MPLGQLLLPNDQFLSPALLGHPSLNTYQRIQDELLAPMRRLHVDQAEFSSLKALLLLSGDVVGMSSLSKEKLREARDALLKALFSYLGAQLNSVDASLRVSSLLMIVPALTSIGQQALENSELASLFGMIDPIKKEIPTPKRYGSPIERGDNLCLLASHRCCSITRVCLSPRRSSWPS